MTCKLCNDTGEQRYWEGRWRDEKAEIERLQTQLGLATCWNNALIKLAGLEGSWVDGGVSVRQVADALREMQPLPSVNWKDGKPYSYCPECGRVEPITQQRAPEK